jgi:hypothetical protein
MNECRIPWIGVTIGDGLKYDMLLVESLVSQASAQDGPRYDA